MVDRAAEFSFFQGIHVRIDIRINITISIRPMITRFAKQVHLQNLTQIRLKTKDIISPVPECLWPPNLAGW